MTHDARESSLQDGEPIELFEFSRGAIRWRHTGGKAQVTYLGKTWSPAVISRSALDYTSEKGRSGIKISCARDLPVADMFRVTPPSDVILLTVHRFHVGESAGVVVWMGRVLNAEWSGIKATLSCEPVASSLARPGLRRKYQRLCPHVLYGTSCNASRAAFSVPVTLSGVSGTTLTSASFALYSAGYFSGGYLDYQNDDGTLERRFISDHSGSVITVTIPMAVLAVGSQVTVYPGCDHTTATCLTKFSNLDNYGGTPYLPTKNPFGGSSLY